MGYCVEITRIEGGRDQLCYVNVKTVENLSLFLNALAFGFLGSECIYTLARHISDMWNISDVPMRLYPHLCSNYVPLGAIPIAGRPSLLELFPSIFGTVCNNLEALTSLTTGIGLLTVT